jgi:hypothetical protein
MRLLRDGPAACRKLSAAGRSHHFAAVKAIAPSRFRRLGEKGVRPTSGAGARHLHFSMLFKYVAPMTKTLWAPLFLCIAAVSAPAFAGAGNFVLVNKTGAAISSVSVRRAGTSSWRPLGNGASNGGRTTITFQDPDCAFDIQAKLGDGQTVTYSGVNLCDVSTVTLNRSANGNQWVDYD